VNIGSVGNQASGALRQTSKSLEWLTRIGFVCKGVVYILIGVLALMAAFHKGGETTDQRGVIQRIANQPFGEFALVVIALGLFAYALWRFVAAASDTEHKGSGAKGVAHRFAQFFSGAVYAAIAVSALKIVIGSGASGGDATQTWTARLMDAPGGTLLVVLAGVAALIGGLFQIHHGWAEKFRESLATNRMSSEKLRWTTRFGRWGYVARGVVFVIVGLFIVIAGLQADASEARGLEGALDTLAAQPFGQWLLALVAAGLACYGAYSIMEARYRRIGH
jgi:hypothetical protein